MKKSKKIPIEKLLFVIPILIILISFLILLFKGQLNFGTINFENLGGYGSFIGGLVGTFLTIIATYYIYKTYHSQKNQLKKQKKQLKLQSVLIAQQQFESTFFNMLNVHRELKNNLSTTHKIFWFTNDQIDFLKCTFANPNDEKDLIERTSSTRKKYGSDVFRNIRLDLIDLCNESIISKEIEFYNKSTLLKDLSEIKYLVNKLEEYNKTYQFDSKFGNIEIENIVDSEKEINIRFKFIFEVYQDVISHYCRNVYHILKYIRENEKNETLGKDLLKYKNYANIFQSQLNVDEQFLLFYNFIHFNNNEKEEYSTIELINHYCFLENLGSNNLIDKELHNNKNFYSFDIK